MAGKECTDSNCGPSEKVLTRRQRERLRHRKEILKAATELFAEQGFAGTTMQDIANRAEFAVGTLYRFFESKDILFGELSVEVFQDATDRLLAVFDEPGDELERLRKYSMVAFDEMAARLRLARIYFSGSGMPFMSLSNVNSQLTDLQKMLVEALVGEFASGIAKGKFVDKDPMLLTRGFQQMLHGYLFYLIDGKELEADKWMEIIDATFFAGLVIK